MIGIFFFLNACIKKIFVFILIGSKKLKKTKNKWIQNWTTKTAIKSREGNDWIDTG